MPTPPHPRWRCWRRSRAPSPSRSRCCAGSTTIPSRISASWWPDSPWPRALACCYFLARFTHNLRPVAVVTLISRSGQDVLAAWTGQMHACGLLADDAATGDPSGPVRHLVAERTAPCRPSTSGPAARGGPARRHRRARAHGRRPRDARTVLTDLYGIPPPPMDRLRGQFAFGRERRTVSAGSTTMSGEHEVTDHDHVVMPVRLRHKVDDPGVSAAAVGGDRRCCSSG
jgi:hypothetical protein